jgi:ABC-type dipeptide/oligopeptide/nickel transport system ATPase component
VLRRAIELLDLVRIPAPERRLDEVPHQPRAVCGNA